MKGYQAAQEWFDGMVPPDHDTILADNLAKRTDEIESNIRYDAACYGDSVVDAISEYLTQENSIPDDIMLGLKQKIDYFANAPFEMRHDPMVRFVYAAIRWKAEQLAREDLK